MTNKINTLINAAQDIVIKTSDLLHSCISDRDKRISLESAAKDIHSLFESNAKINFVSINKSSLQEEAVEAECNERAKQIDLFSVLTKRKSSFSQHILFEIAKIAAAQNGGGVSEHIQNYGLKDPDHLFEIAKIAAAQNARGVSQHIQNYGLADYPDRLLEIAKIAAAQGGGGVSECIQNYGLKDPDRLFEIAKIAAAQNGEGVSIHIQNYGLADYPDHLFEIAKIAATQNGGGVSECIQNYGLKDPDRLFEIAKIAAAQGDWRVSEHIQNYGLKDPDRLFEIAKIAAAQSGGGVSVYIQNYGLKDPDHLFEIAKIAAAQNARGVSQHIQNYGLKDPDRLFEIAKIAAARNARGVSQHIQNYGLKDPDRLFEIAKIAAAQNGWGVSERIQNYGLKDPDRLFEIAKIAAAQSGGGVSIHIQNYGLADYPDYLFEIAKIAAAQSGREVSEYIQNYSLKEPSQLLAIFLIAFHQDREALAHFAKYRLPKDEPLCKTFELLSQENSDASAICKAIQAFAETKNWNIESSLKEITNLKNTTVKKDLLIWLTHFLGSCLLEDLLPDQLNLLSQKDFIRSAISLRDPTFRFTLTKAMLQFSKDQIAQEFVQKSLELSFCKTNNSAIEIAPYKRLPLLLISSLYSQGAKSSEGMCQKLVTLSGNKNFQDLGRLRDLLKGLHPIIETDALTLQDRVYLLSVILEKSKIEKKGMKPVKKTQEIDILKFLKNLGIINALIALQATSSLREEALVAKENDLSAILQQVFQSHLPTKPIADFANRYQEHFGNARLPHYILQYIAVIKHSPPNEKQRLMSTLITCVEAILEGNLESLRYDMEQSPHLKTIFSTREDLFQAWKKGEERLLSDFLKQHVAQKQEVGFRGFLYTKIITDKHLDSKHAPHLTQFLESPESGALILEQIKKTSSSCTENSIEHFLLKVQSGCIQLANSDLDPSEAKNILNKIAADLEQVPGVNEFKNDISALLQGLSAKQNKSYEKFKIIDTDDAQDLFLCGTEVAGSCQRISGEQRFNKCLMGYVLDGKNRLLAVKDASGRIVARHILHILWDETRQQPVLFLERLYPAVVAPEIQEALLSFAKSRAKALGLPLLSTECGRGPDYTGSVQSLGSRAPFEYSDGGGGVIAKGKFQIVRAYELLP